MTFDSMVFLAEHYGGFTSPWKAVVDPRNGEAAYTALVAEHLTAESTVLEAGCGHGAEPLSLAGSVKEIIAFDAVAEFIEIAEAAAAARQVENVRFLQADCSPKRNDGRAVLPVPDQSVDVVISRRGPTSWIPDAPRAVRRGGALIHLAYMVTPEPEWNGELPEELRIHAEVEGMPEGVLERLADSRIDLHSSWTFDVPETFLDPQELYKRLVWDQRRTGLPSFEDVASTLSALFAQSPGNAVSLRQRRFLWKAVVD